MSEQDSLAENQKYMRSEACPFKPTWIPQVPSGTESLPKFPGPLYFLGPPLLFSGSLWVSSRKTTRGFCEGLGLTVAVQSDLFAGVLRRQLENDSLWLPHPSHSPLGGHNLLGPWGLFASPSLSPGPISNYHLPPSNCESCSFISEPCSGWAAMRQGPGDQVTLVFSLGFLLL